MEINVASVQVQAGSLEDSAGERAFGERWEMKIGVSKMWVMTLIALSLCYISMLIALTTLATDIAGYTAKYSAFGRSGSLMVLAGVLLEYNTGSLQMIWRELPNAEK